MALKEITPQEELIQEITAFEEKIKLLKQKIVTQTPSRTTSKAKGWFYNHKGEKVYYMKKHRGQ